MGLVERLDDLGRPAWIALMVLGFVLFWPVGLAILAYLIWSRRMGCSHGARGEWRQRWKDMKRDFRAQRREERHAYRHGEGNGWREGPSGNSAFDEYRAETLKRLEAEQQEFYAYLDRLRHAKDKAEFDQFMAEHRGRPSEPPPAEPPR